MTGLGSATHLVWQNLKQKMNGETRIKKTFATKRRERHQRQQQRHQHQRQQQRFLSHQNLQSGQQRNRHQALQFASGSSASTS